MTSTELLELMGKATKGTWSVEVEEFGNSGSITIPEINRLLHDTGWADPEDWERDEANAALIVALVNHAALFAELLAEREVGKWSKPIGTGAWLELHRGTEFLGIIYHRKSEGDFYWNALGRGNHCATEAEAKAAVEAAIRGAK